MYGPNPCSRTILLAEDEAFLRELAETILRQAGYRVLTFQGRAGLDSLFHNQDDDVDLLLTDVVMPEISGQEVASLVRLRWPKVRVIYTSGYPSDELGFIGHDEVFLQKPFTPGELMEKIREVLEG